MDAVAAEDVLNQRHAVCKTGTGVQASCRANNLPRVAHVIAFVIAYVIVL